jgi:hypothetical protein
MSKAEIRNIGARILQLRQRLESVWQPETL